MRILLAFHVIGVEEVKSRGNGRPMYTASKL
jgi:hypothetical protein